MRSRTVEYRKFLSYCLLLALPASALDNNDAYTTSQNSLLSVNINTGAEQHIGPVVGHNFLSALTFDVTTNALLCVDGEHLFELNPNNAAPTIIGSHGLFILDTPSGLACDGMGNLYMLHDDSLYTLNRTTGLATLVGSGAYHTGSAIEFSPTGELYAIAEVPALNGLDGLLRLNPATGGIEEIVGTIRDPLEPGPFIGSFGIDFDSRGALYVASSAHDFLYVASLDDASLIRVGTLPVTFGSLAIFRDCNENDIHDAREIALGTAADANGDGIPDVCGFCGDGICQPVENLCSSAVDCPTTFPTEQSGAWCNDGLYCNGVETCDILLGCQAGSPVYCNDNISCTSDTCNENSDSCTHTPINAACDDSLYCNGAEICSASLGCQNGTPACGNQTCNESDDSCGAGRELWMVFSSSATVPGVGTVETQDITSYNLETQTWSIIFDGSDVGLTLAIDGIARLSNGAILLSFVDPGNVPGMLGGPDGLLVDDSDIVKFTPTSLGTNTAGSFSFHFDASDVNASGQLILSTNGSYSVTGASGNGGNLIAFSPTSLGSVTAGTFSVYFDGSDVGLSATAAENLDAATIRASGAIHYSTSGDFSVPGLSGTNEDIVQFNPTLLGPTHGRLVREFPALDENRY